MGAKGLPGSGGVSPQRTQGAQRGWDRSVENGEEMGSKKKRRQCRVPHQRLPARHGIFGQGGLEGMLALDLNGDLGPKKKKMGGTHGKGAGGAPSSAGTRRHPSTRPALRQSPIDPTNPGPCTSGSHRAGCPAFPAASGAGLDGYRSRWPGRSPGPIKGPWQRSICAAARPATGDWGGGADSPEGKPPASSGPRSRRRRT